MLKLCQFLDGPVAGPVDCRYGTKGKTHPKNENSAIPWAPTCRWKAKHFRSLTAKQRDGIHPNTWSSRGLENTSLWYISIQLVGPYVQTLLWKGGRIKNSDDDVRKQDKSSIPPDKHTVNLWSKHFLSFIFIVTIHFVHTTLLVFCSAALLNPPTLLCVVLWVAQRTLWYLIRAARVSRLRLICISDHLLWIQFAIQTF